MNKTSNLSMMVSLLFVCISISNVYGVDGPWKFKLKLGQLTSHLNQGRAITGLYYQLECNQNADGTNKWIFKSTEDGYDYTDTTDTTQLDEFDIPDQGTILTPWYIETSDYYYGCDLYLIQPLPVPLDDAIWGHGSIGEWEIRNMGMDKAYRLGLADPNDFASIPFDVELYGEAELYYGPWKFELTLSDITNLNDMKEIKNIYYQLACFDHMIKSSDPKDASIVFTSYQDGYDWEYYHEKGIEIYVLPFNLAKGGEKNSEKLIAWQIDSKDKDGKDLYFYNCDLWIVQKGSVTDSYLATAPVPLSTFNEEYKVMEMYLHKPGDDSKDDPPFHLDYGASQGRVEIQEKDEL